MLDCLARCYEKIQQQNDSDAILIPAPLFSSDFINMQTKVGKTEFRIPIIQNALKMYSLLNYPKCQLLWINLFIPNSHVENVSLNTTQYYYLFLYLKKYVDERLY